MAINGRGRPTKEQKRENDLYRDLMKYVTNYDRDFKKWTARGEKILKRYTDDNPETGQTSQSKFNVLWSNVQTLVPATYSRIPQPDVSRRFRDNDPVGRVGALILERALDYDIQHYSDFRSTMDAAVQDRFLPGRGTAWARYEPKIETIEEEEQNGEQVSGDVESAEELRYECAVTDYVHWRDFGHNVARTWSEVHTVWRVVYMGRDALVERFGEEEGNKIPLDSKPETNDKKIAEDTEETRGKVYEFWSKQYGNKAIWVSKSLRKILDEQDDPLELEEFFPCPKPLYATITNDSLVPIPDYTLYQDQARMLNVLIDRIDGLVQSLQVKGVYNGEFPEIIRLFTEGTNTTMIPVKTWAKFSEKQGLSGAIDILDLKPVYEALEAAFKVFAEIMKQIYDITGISDIIRGQSDPRETAEAQGIKGQFAGMRLGSMKHDVAEFATEIIRLKAQIMLNKFEDATLLKIASVDQLSQEDQAIIPQALALLKDRAMEGFRIDIAADSLVQLDEQSEKESRTEFVKIVTTYLTQIEPIINTQPQLATLAMELLKFAIVPFKAGKTLEGMIDKTAEQIEAKAKKMAAQPPPPTPEQQKIQGDIQIAQIKVQGDAQTKQAAAQLDAQGDAAKAQATLVADQHRMAFENQMRQRELAMEAQADAQRQQQEAAREALQAKLELLEKRFEAVLRYRGQVESAEIAAQATLSAAPTSAAAPPSGAN